jgi:hypothetical protein
MGAAVLHMLITGSYISADFKGPELLTPPATSTFPFGINTARWVERAVAMPGTVLHLLSLGSNRCAELR